MPKGLTQSWIAAMATLPPEWQMMGVVRGPREVDPKIQSASRVAWAHGPDGERVEAGATPEPAHDPLGEYAARQSGDAVTRGLVLRGVDTPYLRIMRCDLTLCALLTAKNQALS
jgi:hypothetical protein